MSNFFPFSDRTGSESWVKLAAAFAEKDEKSTESNAAGDDHSIAELGVKDMAEVAQGRAVVPQQRFRLIGSAFVFVTVVFFLLSKRIIITIEWY